MILDASWAGAAHRRTAATVAQLSSSEFMPFCCEAPAPVAEARIEQRMPGASDADLEIARAVRARFDDWPDAMVVRTTDQVGQAVAAMTRVVRPRG